MSITLGLTNMVFSVLQILVRGRMRKTTSTKEIGKFSIIRNARHYVNVSPLHAFRERTRSCILFAGHMAWHSTALKAPVRGSTGAGWEPTDRINVVAADANCSLGGWQSDSAHPWHPTHKTNQNNSSACCSWISTSPSITSLPFNLGFISVPDPTLCQLLHPTRAPLVLRVICTLRAKVL